MEACTKQIALWKMPLLLNIMTPNLSPDDDNSTSMSGYINKKPFHILSYFKHLQTLDNPAMWHHVIYYPEDTQSQRQNVPFLQLFRIALSINKLVVSLKLPFLETLNNYRVWSE